MLTFRWLILRLFWSLLLLPLVAFPLLWFLHEVAFPQAYFADEFVVTLVWILVFATTSWVLSRLGMKRFTHLEEAGRKALTQNQEEEIEEVFALMQSLFAGGLLSERFQQKIKLRLLRQYFSFYAAHPEKAQYREQLLEALRTGIRAEESYDALKNFVITQPALTLPVIDLAEELLEHQPDDNDLLVFLTRQYLRERQTHYRAEHIYTKSLSGSGTLTPEILSLCLNRLVRLQRRDDFAAWSYVRAFQTGEGQNSVIRRLLYEIHRSHQRRGRSDALAHVITTIVADFAPEEMESWVVEQQEKRGRSWRFRLQRIFFHLQQWLLELYSRLRERRKLAYAALGAVIVLGAGYFALFRGQAQNRVEATPVATTAVEDSTTAYFTLQVGALRSVKIAEGEAAKFRRRGLEVHVLKPGPSQSLHRIRVGKYRSKQAAQMAADSLKAAGLVRDYFIANYEEK
jgi:SPOR domain